jgi:ring-1,2-phenylacetyl-CoA epoxidase subunit PaaC
MIAANLTPSVDDPSPPLAYGREDALALRDCLLGLADNGLVLAQRLCEWVGKGPILEEDIASTNVGLDLLGQARLWYAVAGELEAQATGQGRDEDQFAFRRDTHEFRNLLLCEQPNGSYADTIVRQFLFDQWHRLMLAGLASSHDARIAGIAAKAGKEVGLPCGALGRLGGAAG